MSVRSMKSPRLGFKEGRSGRRVLTSLGEADFNAKTITNSARGTFSACHFKFLLQYGHRLTTRGIIHYFWIGQAIHDEFDRMYTSGRFDKAGFRRRLDAAVNEALKQCVGSTQEEKLMDAHAVAAGLVPVYADRFLEHDLVAFDFLELEGTFSIPIPGTDWTYRGKRDGVVQARKDSRLLRLKAGDVGLWENKTTAQMDVNYFARLPLDFQILGYVWSMQQQQDVDFSNVSFIFYNVMQKSRLRQKRGESRVMYLNRVEQDYSCNPIKYFYRERVAFDQRAIDQFVQELTAFVVNLEFCMEKGIWPKNDKECTNRGMCEFFRLCTEGIDRDTLSGYRQKATAHEELEDSDGQ